jgi:hypothetical protein
MNTKPVDPDAIDSSALRRQARQYRIGPRDVFRFVSMAAAFLLVGFLCLFAFGLVFNEVTIYGWLFIGGVFTFRHGFIQYRNRLAVSGTATAKASSAAIGLAELSGRGYAERVSDAPISKTPCLFWSLEVQQWQTRPKRRWTNRVSRSFGAETLELEDDTGRVLVWTRGAQIIPVKQVWRSEEGNPPDAALRLIAASGLRWPESSSRNPMKITEERIESGAPLYVMGTLAERRQIPDTPTSFLTRLLTGWAESSPRLAAPSFFAAFRFASQGARRWFARDMQALVPRWTPPNVDRHQVLVWKGDQRRPFIISGLLERDAMKALSRRAWLYILGGAALMAGTLLVTVWKLTDVMR